MKVNIPGYDKPLTIKFDTYKGNGRLAVVLVSEDGQPFATLSCNVSTMEIGDGEFAVKTWSENEEIVKACRPLFIDTDKRIFTANLTIPIWRRRHDPKIVVMVGSKPIAIFDNENECQRWYEKNHEHGVTYSQSKVPYKP